MALNVVTQTLLRLEYLQFDSCILLSIIPSLCSYYNFPCNLINCMLVFHTSCYTLQHHYACLTATGLCPRLWTDLVCWSWGTVVLCGVWCSGFGCRLHGWVPLLRLPPCQGMPPPLFSSSGFGCSQRALACSWELRFRRTYTQHRAVELRFRRTCAQSVNQLFGYLIPTPVGRDTADEQRAPKRKSPQKNSWTRTRMSTSFLA